jgi:tetratricopeptide (TPR) repeat protein
MLRTLLGRFGRRAATEAESEASAASAREAARSAAELSARGREQRLGGEYADAERSLTAAIERKHDFGPAHYELGLVYLEQRRAEDAVDCLRLAIHFLPRFASACSALGAAFVALGRHEAAEAECRKALELDPGSSEAWFNLGRALKGRGDLKEAANALRAALKHDANNADAACQLGFVLFRSGRYEEAREVYEALIAAHPDFAEAHHNFGLLQLETGYAAEALANFQRTLALKPAIVETAACVGHALRDLGRLEEAIQAYDAVLARQPQFGDAVINRCYALLMRGDYARGWPEYERRFAATGTAERDSGVTRWRGESLNAKRVLVFAEQGIGDEIMFASCLPDLLLTAGHCFLECNTRLAALFSRSFPQASVHGGEKTGDTRWLEELAPLDYQLSIGSLPMRYRRTSADFPARPGYLKADPARIAFWRATLAALSGRPRIGIAWRGGTLRNRQYLRSTRLEEWLPILERRGVGFVSLQHGDHTAELLALRERGIAIHEVAAANEDLDELAALTSALDLVITVDNTVAHLAGALGVRVWIMLPYSPEWRYLREGEAMPWYPSARLFRQTAPRNRAAVIARIAVTLGEEYGKC